MNNSISTSRALPNQNVGDPSLMCSSLNVSNSNYAELKRLLKNRGLLDKQPAYYTYRIALLLCLLVLGLIFFLVINVFWQQLLDAVYLAFVFGQIGLLSHEAGHHQMFHHSWKHAIVGLVGGNFLIGVSYAWWLEKHNRHHSHPNQVGMDPDIEIPLLDFTGTEDLERMGKFRRFIVKHQAPLLFPALMTVVVSLRCNSANFLLRKKAKYYVFEWFLIIAHFVLYFAFVLFRLGFWKTVPFVCLHQALTGFYLGSIFAPNHKGMPIIEKESNMGWLYRQALTSRNIHAHPLTDYVYGGLNYQIEHHLFPSMARNKLKEAQPIVKDFCQVHAIPYRETSVYQSFIEIFQYLHHIGAPLRRSSLPDKFDLK